MTPSLVVLTVVGKSSHPPVLLLYNQKFIWIFNLIKSMLNTTDMKLNGEKNFITYKEII